MATSLLRRFNKIWKDDPSKFWGPVLVAAVLVFICVVVAAFQPPREFLWSAKVRTDASNDSLFRAFSTFRQEIRERARGIPATDDLEIEVSVQVVRRGTRVQGGQKPGQPGGD